MKKYVHFQSQRVPKWKSAHIWQSKEHKNNKKTPKNVSQKGLQRLTDVLQHPVFEYLTGTRLICWYCFLIVSQFESTIRAFLRRRHKYSHSPSPNTVKISAKFCWHLYSQEFTAFMMRYKIKFKKLLPMRSFMF